MFKREKIEGYYFDVVREVGEKYKRKWLKLTEKGSAEIDITSEMAAITLEVIAKLLFGQDSMNPERVAMIHHACMARVPRLPQAAAHFPLPLTLEKIFRTPRYVRYQRELDNFDELLAKLIARNTGAGVSTDKYNMLTLLLGAQREDPEHFTDRDIRDQCATMIFAGFETTSILMQWLWYTLDSRPDVEEKLRAEITRHAPCTATGDSSGITYAEIGKMDYLAASVKETMRLYPSIWMTGREPVEEDHLGDYKVKPGTMLMVPQLMMHRHPRWWDRPNAFILKRRFLGENDPKLDDGLYFPFSLGARKCTGAHLAQMEAKVIFAKLLPLFSGTALNSLGNAMEPALSLKLKTPLRLEIRRV